MSGYLIPTGFCSCCRSRRAYPSVSLALTDPELGSSSTDHIIINPTTNTTTCPSAHLHQQPCSLNPAPVTSDWFEHKDPYPINPRDAYVERGAVILAPGLDPATGDDYIVASSNTSPDSITSWNQGLLWMDHADTPEIYRTIEVPSHSQKQGPWPADLGAPEPPSPSNHPRLHASAVRQVEGPVEDYAGFAQASFPLPSIEHAAKRDALMAVLCSNWKLANAIEPEEMLLLQFMRYDSETVRWNCTFWRDGAPCKSACKGKDHAKGHVRLHIQHFPFACTSPCPRTGGGCGKRYSASEPLYKHRIPKIQCPDCGLSMLQGSLLRHRDASCKGAQSPGP